jgi:type II secretory ATPase GspE/PulE/Tfp pilus assembly ATPase PilB-like protein
MAKVDISERRKPQDGKINFKIGDRAVELRLATLPMVTGTEDVILRILPDRPPMALAQLGLSDRNLRFLEGVVKNPDGMVLVSGPTGSGKTSTLHSLLQALNSVDTKILTAEDPVEITQRGLRQVQINPKAGLTFASVLRSFLRADPDVIMIGEMRDQETATTAVEAALTGHLVLSTLHTKSAAETISRIMDIGVESYSLGDALRCVVSQRLVRAVCTRCREQKQASSQEYIQMAEAYGRNQFREYVGQSSASGVGIWTARGCEACGQTGYRGRVALHEVLMVDDTLRLAIQKRQPAVELRNLAVENGMHLLVQDGVEKMLQGLTDMRQVLAASSR